MAGKRSEATRRSLDLRTKTLVRSRAAVWDCNLRFASTRAYILGLRSKAD